MGCGGKGRVGVALCRPEFALRFHANHLGFLHARPFGPGVVHAGIGKASFDAEKIAENATAFIEAIKKARPSGAKGTYIKKITLSSTMGSSVFIDDSLAG